MENPPLPHAKPLHWSKVHSVVPIFELIPDRTRSGYEERDDEGVLLGTLHPPLVLVGSDGLPGREDLGARSICGPGRFGVLVLTAEAASMGLYEGDTLQREQQVSGRSLQDTGAKIQSWFDKVGVPPRLYVSCATPLLRALAREHPTLPLDPGNPALIRLPVHERVPSLAHLRDTQRAMAYGRIAWSPDWKYARLLSRMEGS